MKTYNFFKNTKYALEGLLHLLKNESSFKIEFVFSVAGIFLSFFLKVSFLEQIALIASLALILIIEALNSALEACVDLVTQKYNKQAKIAKDCASSAVFLAVLLALVTWSLILANKFL